MRVSVFSMRLPSSELWSELPAGQNRVRRRKIVLWGRETRLLRDAMDALAERIVTQSAADSRPA